MVIPLSLQGHCNLGSQTPQAAQIFISLVSKTGLQICITEHELHKTNGSKNTKTEARPFIFLFFSSHFHLLPIKENLFLLLVPSSYHAKMEWKLPFIFHWVNFSSRNQQRKNVSLLAPNDILSLSTLRFRFMIYFSQIIVIEP